MKNARLAGIGLALLLCTMLVASDDEPDKTLGAFNGRFWQKCNAAVKTGFIVGFNSAMQASTTISKQEVQKYTAGVSFGEMVKGVDQIYQTPENASLPIWVAIRIVVLKANGVPEDKIGETLVTEGIWRPVNH